MIDDIHKALVDKYGKEAVRKQSRSVNVDFGVIVDAEDNTDYRIVSVEQANAGDNSTWNITIDQPYPEASAKNMKHAVGAVFVGAPWEIVVPTELVYLRNPQDKLPVYPLT